MNSSLNKRIIWLAIGSLFVLLGLEFFLNYDTTDRQIALAITNLVTLAIYLSIHLYWQKKFKIELPWIVIWSVAIGVWLDAVGNFAHYYVDLAWYDDFTHVVGTMTVAVALFVILRSLNRIGQIKVSRFVLSLFTVSLSVMLSSFYEITEYWGDMMFNTYRIGDRFDTASDLMWNLLGAVVVVLVANLISKKQSIREVSNNYSSSDIERTK
ncbi:MAG: hypothetical protein ABIB97_00325 [Patescibacteria group bacterium]